VFDKWHFLIGSGGATWPSHGLPCSTLWLALRCCVKVWGLHQSRTPDLHRATDWQDWANHPRHYWFLTTIWQLIYLSLFKGLNGGGKGWGLAPAHGLLYLCDHKVWGHGRQSITTGTIQREFMIGLRTWFSSDPMRSGPIHQKNARGLYP
jgi:hypothetical protein